MIDVYRILLDIAIILFFAKIFGEISEKFKMSHLVGEIIAGIVVGPVLHLIAPGSNEILEIFSAIGVILLLYLIGLSTKFEEIKEDIYPGTYIAIVAALVSLASGFLVGFLVFNSLEIGLVVGVVLMGTSTAIPVKILADMGEIRSRVGRLLITTSMSDDIITLITLAAISTYFTFGTVQLWTIVALVFTVIGFILASITVGEKISNKVLSFVQRMRDEQILLAIPLVIIFIVSFVSQRIGIAAVTGAFLAGMAMSKSVFAEPVIAPKIRAIGYGFFIPIFFAYSALIIDLALLVEYWWLIAILVVIGGLLKAIASGWMSGFFGLYGKDRITMAIGMVPRGEYGIVISQLALGMGIISAHLYGSLVAFVAVTAIITPIMFRFLIFNDRKYGR
ncbi:MAG: cation:proton antiporter [Candidatus Aenigmarchaeota archaeon]|nr:cation:proton antiporter [Candidatus Aenigmarchaeota archaeon]